VKPTSIRLSDELAARVRAACVAYRQRTGQNMSLTGALRVAVEEWAGRQLGASWSVWSGEDPRGVAGDGAEIVIWTTEGTAHAGRVLNDSAWGVAVDHARKGYRTIGREDAWPAGWVWCLRPGEVGR